VERKLFGHKIIAFSYRSVQHWPIERFHTDVIFTAVQVLVLLRCQLWWQVGLPLVLE